MGWLLKELQRFPAAGRFEDTLAEFWEADSAEFERLRQQAASGPVWVKE
ncbi:MAG: hypothetical protein HYW07_16055 [Candidatus Latescibacteria bacterium]|nr:hypothetical protein [Candidatus Latescibacterota bacterium]